MDYDIVSDLNNDQPDGIVPATADVTPLTRVADKAAAIAKVVDAPAAPDKPKSLRDQISSAIKGEVITPDVARQDGGLVRNPDGTFAPKPGDVVVDPSAPVVPVAEPARAPQGIDPTVFSALPAETQASLARTMEDIGNQRQRLAVLDQLEQTIAPRRQAWALNGMTETQAVTQLLALSDFAGRDPPGFIKYMAENSGVNLEDLAFGEVAVDPETKALNERIASLEGQLKGVTTTQQSTAHQQVVSSVISFASEKGADGNMLRPYFEELGENVLPFISAVKGQNPQWSQNQVLQEAYDRACWGTPSIRTKMQAAVEAAGEAERMRQAALKVGNARAASVSVKSGAPTSPAVSAKDGTMSMRETIRASIAAHS